MNRNSLSAYDSAMLSDDGDLYSDDDDAGNYGGDLRNGLGDKGLPSAADRRAHHNALERKRRDHIKDSFTSLRDSVPSLQGEKVTASRAQILKKAAEYIQFMRKKNTNVQADIDEIAKQNKMLEEQIRRMEMQRTGGAGGGISNKTSGALSSLFSANESTDVSPSYDISENSNGSSNSGLGSGSLVGATSPATTTGSSSNSTPVPTVSIISGVVDSGNSNNLIKKNTNGTVLNGTLTANTVSVRPVTVKNGTSKIIVQNPQHKSAPHVIHVTTTPGAGTVTANGTIASNIAAMSSTGTPIIISTSQLSSSSGGLGTTNGTNTSGYVISKGGGAISLANGFRTLVVQSSPAGSSGTPTAVTTTPNIHILGTSSQPPTKKLRVITDLTDSIISTAGNGSSNGIATSVTSISS